MHTDTRKQREGHPGGHPASDWVWHIDMCSYQDRRGRGIGPVAAGGRCSPESREKGRQHPDPAFPSPRSLSPAKNNASQSSPAPSPSTRLLTSTSSTFSSPLEPRDIIILPLSPAPIIKPAGVIICPDTCADAGGGASRPALPWRCGGKMCQAAATASPFPPRPPPASPRRPAVSPSRFP